MVDLVVVVHLVQVHLVVEGVALTSYKGWFRTLEDDEEVKNQDKRDKIHNYTVYFIGLVIIVFGSILIVYAFDTASNFRDSHNLYVLGVCVLLTLLGIILFNKGIVFVDRNYIQTREDIANLKRELAEEQLNLKEKTAKLIELEGTIKNQKGGIK